MTIQAIADVTPTLAETIRTVIDSALMNLHVCLPAKIVTYDPTTQKASVQVQLLTKYEDGTVTQRPVIPSVPVKHPRARAGSAFIHLPVQPGDDVILVFSERSLDNWKSQGGLTDPKDRRKFNLSDAFALIGGSAFPNAFTPMTTDSIEIVNGQTHMVIHPDGSIEAKNNTAELIDTLISIADQAQSIASTLSTDTVNTVFGPQLLNAFSTYATIASTLTTLIEKLESFKPGGE